MATNPCGLTTVKASATIKVGAISVSTPNIVSISVNRTRGQVVSSCAVSFIFNGDFKSNVGAPLIIYFYNELVWTGVVKRMGISPSLRCAGEIMVKLQGEDILHKLENRNITRRQKLAGLGPLAFITSVHKRTSLGFDDLPSRHDISNSSSPIHYFTPTINMREHTQFLMGNENITGQLHPVTKVADPITGRGKGVGGGGSFILHDHSTLDLTSPHSGGPAFAVYSSK